MAHLTASEIQQFLDTAKMAVAGVDPALDTTSFEEIADALVGQYPVATWVDQSTTPVLIRQILGMKIAADLYARQYSEDQGKADSYAGYLRARAASLLTGLQNGTISLRDVSGDLSPPSEPSYWPNDTTGSSDLYDAQGNLIGLAGVEDIKFTMGKTF